LSPFELAEPRSLGEAFAALDTDDPGVRPLSGGTALMLMMKAGVLRPTRLVSLAKLGLTTIELSDGGALRIGSMVGLRTLESSEIVRRGWPVIARTLLTLSNVRVRNVATIGGHLAHGDPHMDLPPLLSALGASVTLESAQGTRTLPVHELITGYYETTLHPGELVTRVEVPPLGERRAVYLKCTARSADDWPALGMAVVLDSAETRIFISAATDKPTRLVSAEKELRNGDVTRAAQAGAAEVQIEGDSRGSAAYKQQLIRVYLARAIHEARNPAR
jgi:aerobic carbon-monoxide dehydrogenase medium subunit